MRDRHARELALPLVVGWLADAVLSARLVDLGTEFDLLEDADYLGFTESRFLHVETPLGGFSTSGWFRKSRGLQLGFVYLTSGSCGFNRSMQHNDRLWRKECWHEAKTADLLHRSAEGPDVGSLESWRYLARNRQAV
ncbi:hypothetical protein D3C71_1812420 [compost metagenome]